MPTEEEIASGYVPDFSPAPSLDEDTYDDLQLRATDLPDYYDGRELGFVTPVKHQRDLGTCWAFATLGTIESSLVRQGKADSSLDLSELHLTYFLYHSAADPLGNTAGDASIAVRNNADDKPDLDKDPYLNIGGNYLYATHCLASWTGAADELGLPDYDEFNDAYVAAGKTEAKAELGQFALDASLSHADSFHLTQARRIPLVNDDGSSNADVIKQAVMEYGGVGLSIRLYGNALNTENGAYYNPNDRGDGHAVTLVGWDDNYSKTNFKAAPQQDGAWICKNSHGDGTAEGYFYISYAEPRLNMEGARGYVFEADPVGTLDNVYQYDGTAGTCMNYVESGGSIANVFEVKANEGGCERLKAVSLALSDASISYSIQVYANPTDPTDPTSGSPALAQAVQGTTTYAGYYTIDLGDGAVFDEGDSFAVVATLSSQDGSSIRYDVDCTYGALCDRYSHSNNKRVWYQFDAHVEPGQSFEQDKAGATWDDLSSTTYDEPDEPACSARLKAFTVNESLDVAFDLSTAEVSAIDRQRYVAQELTPAPCVMFGNEILRQGRDYRVSYTDNVQVGSAHVTIEGIGRYSGTLSTDFEIYAEPMWARLGGATALDTMQCIVQADGVFNREKTQTVIVATADDFRDALSASGLAGRLGAPVLITPNKSLAAQTRNELLRLDPSEVIVVGSAAAIRDATLRSIRSALPKARVYRVEGPTGIDTSLALWRAGDGWGDTAIVVTSNGYKDALSIAPYSYAQAAPIFLANPAKALSDRVLSNKVLDAIDAGGFSRVVIVGSNLAIPESVDRQLQNLSRKLGRTIQVVRLPGANAIETSRLAAQFALSEGMTVAHMAVATTAGYKDGLCGAALAGSQNSILVLADKNGGYNAFDAVYNRNQVVHAHVLGSNLAISDQSWTHFTNK